MNKKLAIAVLAASLPLAVTAAGTQNSTSASTDKQQSSFQVFREKQNTGERKVVPIDLDSAATQYDIVLPPAPVKMTADAVLARNTDGYIQGRGNVDIYQGTDEIHANYVEGNTKTQMFYIPGDAVWLQGDTMMSGTGIIYNGKTRGATMDTMGGFISPNTYIRGTDGEMYDGQGYLKKGIITTPHAVAKTPDYYLSGDDIHIYPGVKFTSENTKFWFKHVCLFTYGHYEGRLDNRSRRNTYLYSLLPRPHYTADDGFGVYGGTEIPLNQDENFNLDVHYAIHTKSGFQPTVQLVRDSRLGRFTLGYKTEESTDNDKHIWAKKFPEFNYYMPRINFGTTGIYMDNSLSYGRWQEDGIETGTHKGYKTEITHKPLPLWRGANIRFFAGYRRDIYSTNDAMRRDPYSGVGLNQSINDHMWTYWWYTKHNLSGSTPYRFDSLDHPRQKGVSVGYRLTPLDTFVLTFDKDLDTREVADRNITWVRDLHSFVASGTWKTVTKEWDVQVVAKDFS